MRNEDGRMFTFFCTCVRHIALLLLTLSATAVACKTQQSILIQPQIKKDRPRVACMVGRFWGILRSLKVICNAERAVIDFVSILGPFAFIAL